MLSTRSRRTVQAMVIGLALSVSTTALRADEFGSGVSAFTIDFVEVGNAGNADDAGAGGGSYSSPYGGVAYNYRIGVHEVSEENIQYARNAGLILVDAGAWSPSMPAGDMTWYECAAFVNWLNTSTGHQAAYNLRWVGGQWTMSLWSSSDAWQPGGENLYRHKDAHYFLPSEDEWYKAAYHQNDGVTANYWDYATGSNAAPTAIASGTAAGTAVFGNPTGWPAAVALAGGLSAYGTMGQGGNAWEMLESAYDGSNDQASENRVWRGADFGASAIFLNSSVRGGLYPPSFETDSFGFRVASISIPEPSAAALAAVGLGAVLLRRRGRESKQL